MELLKEYFDTAMESPDGIKKLRELILTLAMQGKLTPQNPDDQPAKELLEEIKSEKEKLIAEGKTKKQKPLPPIKPEEIPYEIPESWEWVRLGTIAEILMGQSPKGNSYNSDGHGVPLVNGPVEFGGKSPFEKTVAIKFTTAPTKLCKKGDLLLCVRGSTTGRTNIAGYDSCIGRGVAALQPYIFKLFFNYYILHLRTKWIEISTGSTFPNISFDKIAFYHFPLPPLAEQRRIVEKIDQLMAICDELEEQRTARDKKQLAVHTSAINSLVNAGNKESFNSSWQFITRHFNDLYSFKENVVELKKAVLTLAMQGKLVEQNLKDQPAKELLEEIKAEKEKLIAEGKIKKQKPLPPIKPEEIPYEIPDNWEWVRLVNVLDVRDGTHDTPKYVNQGIPLITSKNLYTGVLSFDEIKYISIEDHLKIKERSNVDTGDILFAMIGSIGNPVIVDTSQEFSIKNVALFKFYQNGKPSNRFVHLFLHLAQENMKSISSGAVQSFVSLGFLREYPFPLPPLAEQKRIVEKIDQLMALCEDLENNIEYATQKRGELFDAVLARV